MSQYQNTQIGGENFPLTDMILVLEDLREAVRNAGFAKLDDAMQDCVEAANNQLVELLAQGVNPMPIAGGLAAENVIAFPMP